MAFALVAVVAAITPILLGGLGLPADLIERLGLGWAAAIPAVDRLLGSRLGLLRRKGEFEQFGQPRVVVYAAALTFGILNLVGVTVGLNAEALLLALPLSLSAGGYAFFRLGRWIGGRMSGGSVSTLIVGAMTGATVVRLFDYAVLGPEDYELLGWSRTPESLLLQIVFAAAVWGLA
ncbi:MAG: hypothetical protein ACRD0K_25810 [Egibacteraceae bacterium]